MKKELCPQFLIDLPKTCIDIIRPLKKNCIDNGQTYFSKIYMKFPQIVIFANNITYIGIYFCKKKDFSMQKLKGNKWSQLPNNDRNNINALIP